MTKFEELMENEEFVKGLDDLKSVEEVAAAFKAQGVDVEKEMPETTQNTELSENDLKQVSGGSITVAGLLAACAAIGGTKWLSTLWNGSCFSAYMILRKSNSDYKKKGNMYRTYSKKEVDNAMKTLENAMYKAGFGWAL